MKQESATNHPLMKWLGGIALGAVTMYLTDPDRGKRRRALARDKMQSMVVRTGDAIDLAARDLNNRMQGLRAQASRMMIRRKGEADDQVVAARVRSRIGRVVSHSHAIKVMVQQGQVTLNGPVLAHEKDALLKAVRSVPGVNGIEEQLQVPEQPDSVSALQGEGRPRQIIPSILQDNWPPALRAIAAVSGSVLGYVGMKRRTPGNLLLVAIGAGLLARAATNRPLPALFSLHRRQPGDPAE